MNYPISVGAALFFLSFHQAFAVPVGDDCRSRVEPSDYQVFSAGSISAQNADFQGPTGAGGGVALAGNFQVNNPTDTCASLVAGGSVTVRNSSIDGGNLESGGNVNVAPDANVNDGSIIAVGSVSEHGFINGRYDHSQTSSVAQLYSTAQNFVSKSDEIASLPSNCSPSVGFLSSTASFPNSDPSAKVRVYTMSASQLASAGTLDFQGEPGQVIVVNVTGSSASILQKKIQMSSDMQMGQIVFNFPQATTLNIGNSGGEGINIPMTILAPRANVKFQNATINGGLYVGSLDDNHGQVNQVSPPWLAIDSYASQAPAQYSCSANSSSSSGIFSGLSGLLNTVEGWVGYNSNSNSNP